MTNYNKLNVLNCQNNEIAIIFANISKIIKSTHSALSSISIQYPFCSQKICLILLKSCTLYFKFDAYLALLFKKTGENDKLYEISNLV